MNTPRNINRIKKLKQSIAFNIFRVISFFIVAILFLILGFIVIRGASAISWEFLTAMPEDGMTKGGIYPAIIGTLILVSDNPRALAARTYSKFRARRNSARTTPTSPVHENRARMNSSSQKLGVTKAARMMSR